jgi:hypothetical protein
MTSVITCEFCGKLEPKKVKYGFVAEGVQRIGSLFLCHDCIEKHPTLILRTKEDEDIWLGKKKLKSCPFCGGEAEINETEDGRVVVGCAKYQCVEQKYGYATEKYAIADWNKRI